MIIADRDMVESASDDILEDAQNVDVAFLVVGDPFGFVLHDGPSFFEAFVLTQI